MSMADLNRESRNYDTEAYQFATAEQAFFDQSLLSFVGDEVHAMLQLIFCEKRSCTTLWNPLYLLLFIFLFIITFPGALMHWLLIDFIPVRSREYPEERELRSQGTYLAIGIAFYCIPISIASAILSSHMVAVISGLSVLVSVTLICFMLIALKAIAEELHAAVRIFILGIWTITLILAGLLIFDVASYFYTSPITVVDYLLRLLQLGIYVGISCQILQFWDLYSDKSKAALRRHDDIVNSVVLFFLWAVITFSLVSVLLISRQNAWRLFLF